MFEFVNGRLLVICPRFSNAATAGPKPGSDAEGRHVTGGIPVYVIKWVRGHIEVFLHGVFQFSADTMREAIEELCGAAYEVR